MEDDVFCVELRPGLRVALASVDDDGAFMIVHLGLSPAEASKFAWWLLSHVHKDEFDMPARRNGDNHA